MRAIRQCDTIPLYFRIMLNLFFRLRQLLYLNSPRGQSLVEYALLIILVGVVMMVVLALFGPAVGNLFSNIISNI
jgi:pilus assembly protein Flp/PilA